MRHIQLATILTIALTGSAVSAQDPITTLPDTYKLQFENDWVKIVHVHLAPLVKLPSHTHPEGTMAFVYLNDAGRVVFSHDPGHGPGSIPRPAVKARGYRLSRAGIQEIHTVENTTNAASDYLRVEFKVPVSRNIRRRVAPPPLKTDNAVDVEETNEQTRITRITIGAGKTIELTTTATEPALLIATTDAQLTVARGSSMDLSLKVGQEHWIETRQREAVTNTGKAAIELLRFDFLAKPAAK